jgi:hypothetical protein
MTKNRVLKIALLKLVLGVVASLALITVPLVQPAEAGQSPHQSLTVDVSLPGSSNVAADCLIDDYDYVHEYWGNDGAEVAPWASPYPSYYSVQPGGDFSPSGEPATIAMTGNREAMADSSPRWETSIVVDGFDLDWGNVPRSFDRYDDTLDGPGDDLGSMCFAHYGTDFYALLYLGGWPTSLVRLYLDTDRDINTGYNCKTDPQGRGWFLQPRDMGCDFIIEIDSSVPSAKLFWICQFGVFHFITNCALAIGTADTVAVVEVGVPNGLTRMDLDTGEPWDGGFLVGGVSSPDPSHQPLDENPNTSYATYPELTVLEAEITSPSPDGSATYTVCQHFDLTFFITNVSATSAWDVGVWISPGEKAEVEGNGEGVAIEITGLGVILAGQTIGPLTYDMHCTGPGATTISVQPLGEDVLFFGWLAEYPCEVSVNQEKPQAALEAEILSPTGGETYSVCQNFDLTFTVHNTGSGDALDVTATIYPGIRAEVEGQGQGIAWTTPILGDIPAGGTIEELLFLHCTGSGETTITVTPSGIDAYTGQPINFITPASVAVIQETPAALEIEISSPVGQETYSICQHFELTFTIHNTGVAWAMDVTATIDPGATAEVEGQGQGITWTTPVLGNIPGGEAVGPFTYDMHCTAPGNSTITVTPAGIDVNRGVAISDITPASITITQKAQAALEVEILSPTGGETYSVCQNFDLTFTVHNSGDADAMDVTATIDPGSRAEVEGQGQGIAWTTPVLGNIPAGGTIEELFFLHCTGSGETTITVTPAGIDENTSEPITNITPDSVAVIQETPAALEAELTSPTEGVTYTVCQHFELTFTIHNTGAAWAMDVTATIDPGATAEVEGQGQGITWTTPVLGNIPGGEAIGPFTYDMHCTASGDSTITVTPAGIDVNRGVAISDITPASITITQEAQATLEVEILSPTGGETYSVCQYFDLTFTVHNSGDADAVDVTATIDPGSRAEVGEEGQGVPLTTGVLGNIPAGGTIGEFLYLLHCTGSGETTITVTPAGIDENTSEPITNITPDSVAVIQETPAALEAELTSPTEGVTYTVCQHFELTFTIHNTGAAWAMDVTATIDPGATAEVEGQGQGITWTTPVLGNIPGGEAIGPFTYDMHCTASGDSTITVTPAGIDVNRGVAIADITDDSVTIKQVSEGPLSGGVIVGIAVGLFLLVVPLAFILYLARKKKLVE